MMAEYLILWVDHNGEIATPIRCAALIRSFAHSLTHSLPSLWERGICLSYECVDFIQVLPNVMFSGEVEGGDGNDD